jgi:hypothetical protein
MKSNTNVNMNKFLESILYGSIDLDESSIYDSTNRRFVERPYGSIDLDESSRRPWGVVNPRYTVW